MWQTPVSNVSPANSMPFASRSARAAATSSTWKVLVRSAFREGTPTKSSELIIGLSGWSAGRDRRHHDNAACRRAGSGGLAGKLARPGAVEHRGDLDDQVRG